MHITGTQSHSRADHGQNLRDSCRTQGASPVFNQQLVVNNIITGDSAEANGHNDINETQGSTGSPDDCDVQLTYLSKVQPASGT